MKQYSKMIGTGSLLALSMLAGCSNKGTNLSEPVGFTAVPRTSPAMVRGTPMAPQTMTARPATTTETRTVAPAATTTAAPAPVASGSGSAVYYPLGVRENAVLLVDRAFPGEVSRGQQFSYDIKVTNVSGITVDDVLIEESAPSGFTVASTNPQATQQGGNMLFNLGRMNPGETKTIRVTGAATGAAVASCATVSYTIPVCMNIAVVEPKLSITKSAPAEVVICDNIPITIVVTNNGTGIARNVRVRDQLPANLMADNKGVFETAGMDLRAGESKTFTFNARASQTGIYPNTAEAMADGGLTATSNQTSTKVTQPVLAVKCEVGQAIRIGQNATFKFTVTNSGDSACNDTTLVANLGGARLISADNNGAAGGNGATWNLGSIPAGQSRTVSVVVAGAAAGNIPVSATVNCGCATPATTTCQVNVVGVPDIGTLVTDDDGVVMVGNNHTYRVEVLNQGQINLTNTRMIVSMPQGMTFVSSADGRLVAGNKVEFDFGVVTPGQRKMSSFVVKSSVAGELLVTGETTCAELRTPVRDDELTNFVQ